MAGIARNNTLETLDLSKNCLGLAEQAPVGDAAGKPLVPGAATSVDKAAGQPGRRGGAAAAAARDRRLGVLRHALASRSYLQHLDLSHNNLDGHAMAVLVARLRDNGALLGLHVWGNAAGLDSHGYVVPCGGAYEDRALAHVQAPGAHQRGLGAAVVVPHARILDYPDNREENVDSAC
jgi:hypothetical protein